jgi:iron complex outermembrane receptor protein
VKKTTLFLCSTAVFLPSIASAQSTGTVETEKDSIVITGTRSQKGVDGIVIQDSTKAKGLITQEYIAKQSPGQTLLSTINYIPGVNFTQNDAYGSSGGNIRIRGFDGNRVSVTFDGVPLNDSGNYAVFSNQFLDPELVEQVNVNLGATDVDSPTASAAGGTVNFRSLVPTDKPGVLVDGSLGTFNFRRVFGMINTGVFTSFGTKAWIAGSRNIYDQWRGDGKIDKWQINARIYQPLGSGGDFVSLAGHYNQNRNNNYNNPNLTDLRSVFGTSLVPSTLPADGSPVVIGDYTKAQWHAINSIAFPSTCNTFPGDVPLTRPTPVTGTAQSDPGVTGLPSNNCFASEEPTDSTGTTGTGLQRQALTNLLGVQINPSNTGNVRGQSRFTLLDGLVLTVDPTYQYVLANGGSQGALISEKDPLLVQRTTGVTGVDLNGDNDVLDTVLLGRPSITNTNRWTVISSLVWKPDSTNTLRVAYTFDRAHHRQTGEYSFTDNNFNLTDPFFGRNGTPVITAAGTVLQNRDRTSIALLNQLSGQYIGKFFDNRLRLEVGVRSPWFQRNLDQHCYTPAAGSGFPVCVVSTAVLAVPTANNFWLVPNDFVPPAAGILGTPVFAPFKAKYKYHKILPNVGATFAINQSLSVFGSYAKGLSAPRTDNLYRQPIINVKPETTDSFDLGARYINGRFQAQATAWKIDYQNRIVTSFDPETNTSIDRNVGKVKSWGVDTGVGFRPIKQLNLIGMLSYTSAKLQQDVIASSYVYVPVAIPATPTSAAVGANAAPPAATGLTYYCPGIPTTLPTSGINVFNICAKTTGKFVVETPKWQYGGRAEINIKPVTVGIQAKRVSSRWATDVNDVKVKGYVTVDVDARLGLDFLPEGKKSYFQLNVINLFNEHYFGNLSTTINAYGGGNSAPRFTPVSTRAITGTLTVGF